MMSDKICFNCFRKKTADGPCPYCGYDPDMDRELYPEALPHGSLLADQYITGRVLGQGGFGITYVALDQKLQIKVAVKEYLPDMMAGRSAGSPQVTAYTGERGGQYQYGLEQFLEEARVLAKFNGNPNIVGVRSFFEQNGTAYFVMDYITGTSFKTHLSNHGGRVSWEEAVRILTPVMDALSAVHKEGIIHRDVTPDNIYITSDGQVKLLDFGAARYSLGDRSRSLDVVLKPGYAPKEQYTRKGRQGPYTDVYSLSACFYAAITGVLPPESLDRMEEDDLVPPSARGIAIPQGLEDVILYGLEVRAEDRYQTMEEFRSALDKAISGSTLPPPPPPPPPPPSLLERIKALPKAVKGGAVAAACLVILLSVLAGSGVLSGGKRSPINSEGDSGNLRTTAQDGGVSQPAVFPLERKIGPTIAAGAYHTVGLRSDGTVVAAGWNHDSQCNVSDWTDIVAIACGVIHTVGLKSDGTVVAVGWNDYGLCDVGSWTNIVAVAAGDAHTVGLKSDGTVVAAGYKDDGQCDIGDWTDIVAIACGSVHTVGLKSDGTVVAVGWNDDGQCDVGGWTDIVAIACGDLYTVGLKSDGTVVAVGENDDGECDVYNWTDIVTIAAGLDHTVGLKSGGTVVAVGDHVDVAHNDDSPFYIDDWRDIVDIAAGNRYTVGLKSDGTVVAVGYNEYGECDVGGWRSILLPDGSNQGQAVPPPEEEREPPTPTESIGGDVIDTTYYQVTMPKSWRGRVACQSVVEDGVEYLDFYQVTSLNEGMGGFLFSIGLFNDVSDIVNEPGFEVLGIISVPPSKVYTVMVIYPTDVQFSDSEADDYYSLNADIPSVLDTFRAK